MIKNILSKSALMILLLWSSLTTYFWLGGISISDIRSHLTLSPRKNQPINIERDYLFITKFLNEYYTINTMGSPRNKEQKMESVKKMVSKGKQERIIKKYRRTLDYFFSQKGAQKFSIQKIVRDQEKGMYRAYLSVYQSFQNKKQYLVKVDLKVHSLRKVNVLNKDSSHFLQNTQIMHFDEVILDIPPTELSNKEVYLHPKTTSQVRLPCPVKAMFRPSLPSPSKVSSSPASPSSSSQDSSSSTSSQGAPSSSASSHVTKNVSSIPVGDGIDIQLSSDLRHIKFYSENSDVMAEVGRTHFEVKCKKRAFKLNLMHNKNLLTVYQSLSLSDGIVKARKRKKPTASDRFEKNVEKQLGLVITDWKWSHGSRKAKGEKKERGPK